MAANGETGYENLYDEADDLELQETGPGYEEGDGDGGVDPSVMQMVERLLAKREEELVKAIESGDTKTGVYKGLQKVLARRDKENQTLRAQLDAAMAKLQQFETLAEQMAEGINWASSVMLGALPEDERQSALQDLQARRSKLAMKELERKVAQASASGPVLPQAGPDDVPDFVKEGRRKFVELTRAMAKKFGVDPDDEGLDYGEDDEPLVQRLERFQASLERVIGRTDEDEGRISAVRRRFEPATTRTGGAGAASAGVSRSSLDEAAARILREIRRSGFRR